MAEYYTITGAITTIAVLLMRFVIVWNTERPSTGMDCRSPYEILILEAAKGMKIGKSPDCRSPYEILNNRGVVMSWVDRYCRSPYEIQQLS